VIEAIDSDARSEVAALTGLAPVKGDLAARRRPDGSQAVYSGGAAAGLLLQTMLADMAVDPDPLPDPADGPHVFSAPQPVVPGARGPGGPAPGVHASQPSGPSRHFDLVTVDAAGEMSGTIALDVARSRTASADNKYVLVTSRTSIKPARHGIEGGSDKGFWRARLPVEYRVSHQVQADEVQPVYVDYFPESDQRTDFEQSDTRTRGFTFGAASTTELTADGAPSVALAAKLPLNLNFTYEDKWQTSIKTSSATIRCRPCQASRPSSGLCPSHPSCGAP
jgi:hemolysin